jgi:cytochrome b
MLGSRKARIEASPVWDLPTRLFHLGLIASVGGCWWTYAADQMAWHRLCGYGATGLLIFRAYWGFAGASTARFTSFLAGPRQLWLYARGRSGVIVGHNPLGGWSVVALLSVLAAEVLSGLFAADFAEVAPGPLSDFVSLEASRWAMRLHALSFQLLLGLVLLHISAVVVHLLCGDNLVGPMLHGRKRLGYGTAEVRFVPWWFSIPGMAAALAVVAGLWWLGQS